MFGFFAQLLVEIFGLFIGRSTTSSTTKQTVKVKGWLKVLCVILAFAFIFWLLSLG